LGGGWYHKLGYTYNDGGVSPFGGRIIPKGYQNSTEMKKTIKTIWNVVGTVMVLAVVVLALLLAGVKLIGLEPYIVQSGSMEPEYPTGSVIYIKEADVEQLEYWDVITYRLTDKTIATHRIIEVLEEDGQTVYRTKGDANEHPDEGYVTRSQVIGTPVFSVPYLGYFVAELQTTRGTYGAISAGAVLLLFLILPDLLFGEDEDKKKGKAEVPVEELPAEPDESVNLSGEIPEKNGGSL